MIAILRQSYEMWMGKRMLQAKKTSCAKDLRKEGLEYFKEMQIVQKNVEGGSGLED